MNKKVMKRVIAFLLVVCMISGSTLPVEAAKKKTIKAKSVKLNRNVYTLKKGKSVSLKATISPKKATTKKITWKSSNKKIATVNKKGKVTAKKKGTVKITAKVKGTSKKATCKIIVGTPVKKVILDKSAVTLKPGQSISVKATVSPKSATTKKVTFSSSNNNIAVVNSQGIITAKSSGRAEITATTKDGTGKKAKITVTVQQPVQEDHKTDTPKPEDKTTAIEAGSSQDVKKALENPDLKELTIKSVDELNLNIEEGKYEEVSLIVNAPKGHIENYGKFKDISIKEISTSTFVEHAVGNTINYSATSGTVNIAEGAVSTMNITAGAKDVNIINEGSLTNLGVKTTSKVNISGQSRSHIPVIVEKEAKDTVISTSQNLDVEANVVINLDISSGAEETVVKIPNKDVMPTITGLGRIEVTKKDSGELLDTIVAENSESGAEQAQKVSVSGVVQIDAEHCLEGVDIYVIPYISEITSDNLNKYTEKAVAHITSDEKGAYKTDKISIGNYYLYAQKEGYEPVVETLILTSKSDEEYAVLNITMMEKAATEVRGILTGRIIDAQTENTPADAGITLRLRLGRNNTSGTPFMTTTIGEDGWYRFDNVPVGQYTIEILDTRVDSGKHCIRTSFGAMVSGAGENRYDSSVTFILDSEQVQFVLSWGNEASGASADLDSHLIGPKVDSKAQFHTWFSDRKYYEEREYTDDEDSSYDESLLCADLDRDDTDWVGPETTTIYKKTEGIYSFYIHDYTNLENSSSDQMSKSSATVKVLVGNKEVASYNMPNKAGNLWHVCDYDSTANKIIPRNAVSAWDEELEDIGVDLFEKYRESLGNYISKVTILLQGISDVNEKANVESMLTEAQKVYDTSDSKDEMKEQYIVLKNWIASVYEKVDILDVTGESIDPDGWYADEDKTSGKAELSITGYTETMPEFEVKVAEGSISKIVDSDDDGYEKMVVVTSSIGITCKYYVTYDLSSSIFSISNISSEDEEGNSLEYDWELEDEIGYTILGIWGCVDEMPENIKIVPNNKETSVTLKDSDKEGYSKMVVLTYLNTSRTYYITYALSSAVRFGIQNISSQNSEGKELIEEWDTTWEYDGDEDDEGHEVLKINGIVPTLPDNLQITPRYSKTTVEIKASDRNDYEKMLVLTSGEKSRSYYIKYGLPSRFFAIKSIIDHDESDNYLIDSYTMSTDIMGKSIIIIYGYGTELTDACQITTAESTTEAKIQQSDRKEYKQMIVLTHDGVSTNIYVDYRISENVFSDFSVYDGETSLDKEMSWDEDEQYGEIILKGYKGAIENELKFESDRTGLTIDVSESDKENYTQKALVKYHDISRVYYIMYKVSEESCSLSGVTGKTLLKYEINQFNDGKHIVDIYSKDSIDATSLQYIASLEQAAVEVMDADISGYDAMVKINYLSVQRIYYVRSHMIESVSTGEEKEISLSESAVILQYVPEESGEYCFYTNGETDTIGILYKEDFEQLEYDDDSGEVNNFKITYNCTAGQTYYISVGSYDSETGKATLHIEKAE